MPRSYRDVLQVVYSVIEIIERGFAFVAKPCWIFAKRIWEFVGPSRFSALTVVAGGLLLVGTDQGRELAARAGEKDAPSIVILILAVEWLAIQSWYWARIVLPVDDRAVRAGDRNLEATRRWKRWIPRSYAILTFVFAVIALVMSDHKYSPYFLAGIGVVTLIFLIFRRPATSKLQDMSVRFRILTVARGGQAGRRGLARLAPLSRVMLLGSAFVAIAALILVCLFPLSIGQTFGAMAIAFFAFGNFIPIGSYLIMKSQNAGFPIIATFLIIAVLSSLNNDNHVVETVGEPIIADRLRLSLEQAVERWLLANPGPAAEPVPLVLVATAGGGLRAAFWTVSVLGALQDRCPQFVRRTFAISGVSGGSVGAAIFAARTATENAEVSDSCNLEPSDRPNSSFMQGVLAKDFLGPTVAAMLFPDFLQRFVPVPFLPSRGATLAEAWVDAWRRTCAVDTTCDKAGEKMLNEPFLRFLPWQDTKKWQPALLLNGTHQETGKRIITSHIKVTRDVFFDAYDTHHVLQKDVPLSTAALNSARFTYVSPPGALRGPGGQKLGHVLDGGYFENYGAVTSAEMLFKLVEVLEVKGRKVRPIVIQITSDPGLALDDQAKASSDDGFLEINKPSARFMNEVAGPIRGLLATRVARGVLAGKTLAETVQLMSEKKWFPNIVDPIFAHFEMCIRADETAPPLGWAMSVSSRALIARLHTRFIEGCDNKAEFEKVVDALRSNS